MLLLLLMILMTSSLLLEWVRMTAFFRPSFLLLLLWFRPESAERILSGISLPLICWRLVEILRMRRRMSLAEALSLIHI